MIYGCKGIISVAAHPDGDIVAAASLDGSVRGYTFSSKTPFTITRGRSESNYAVRQLQFNLQGTYLAGAGGISESVKRWDTTDWKVQDLCVPSNGNVPSKINKGSNKTFVISVAWSPSGGQVACGSMGGSICVFNVPGNEVLHVLNCPAMPVRSPAYSPLKENILVSGSDDECIHVHDVDQKKVLFKMAGHSDWVLSIDVSPDGKTIASGSSDRTVKLWDINTGEPITTRANHSDHVWGAKFKAVEVGAGESLLASVSDDASLSLYKYSSC